MELMIHYLLYQFMFLIDRYRLKCLINQLFKRPKAIVTNKLHAFGKRFFFCLYILQGISMINNDYIRVKYNNCNSIYVHIYLYSPNQFSNLFKRISNPDSPPKKKKGKKVQMFRKIYVLSHFQINNGGRVYTRKLYTDVTR